MLFLKQGFAARGGFDVRNKFLTFTVSIVRLKFTLAIFLLFVFIQPIHASESARQQVQGSAPLPDHVPRKIKKSKIKKITDLRILVDISGSMKKTDPNNLRRSAVRLLSNLIPSGSRAGIWNFGKQVNMAVKVGVVNEAWRDLARSESKKINSAGLYTNIEAALRDVSFDWKTDNPNYKRNLIILTDGHVDVSKNEKEDKESRKRILKEIIPALEQAKVQVHSIALSDDVDERLLTTLSAYTDGLYKKVKSANDLQKLFLQMLEQSVKLDTLPIKDNTFSVDASINDMTLLIFNTDKNNPTKIITPNDINWARNTHSNQVKWFADDGYDLITIKKPQQGQWKIVAPSDDNNRVVVATNLKLKVSDLSGSLKLGEALKIEAYLEEDGKPLSDQRMLSKFKFVLKIKSEHSAEREYPFIKSSDESSKYNVKLAPNFKLGHHELIIHAKSPTVEREIHHQFKVYADPNSLDPEKTQHLKTVENDKHEVQTGTHKAKESNKTNDEHGKAEGKIEKLPAKLKEESQHKNKAANEPAKDGHAESDAKQEKELDWTFISIAIVSGNLLLIGILVGGFYFVKRRKSKLLASLADEDEEPSGKETGENEKTKDTEKEKPKGTENEKAKGTEKEKPKDTEKETPKKKDESNKDDEKEDES